MFKIKEKENISLYTLEDDILRSRGIDNISEFKKPSIKHVEDYRLLNDIEKAVECTITHLKNNSTIFLLVDSDTDGYTSSALLYQYIKKIKPDVEIILGMHEGKQHGLSKDIVNQITNSKSTLVFLPDSGTNDVELCKVLHDISVDVIVLDHHNKEVDNPYAIVVNNQCSEKVTDKSMTGVGITYKFCKALDGFLNVDYADDYLDLVAIGMIGDMADLRNLQSRYYVLQGLKIIENGAGNKFIYELFKGNSFFLQGNLTIKDCGFSLVPKINSIVRNATQEDKFLIFKALCNYDTPMLYKVRGKGEVELPLYEVAFKKGMSYYRKQQKPSNQYSVEISKDVKSKKLDMYAVIINCITSDVDSNYTGLLANKVASKFQKPCILLRKPNTENNQLYTGSGRGYADSEIENLNEWCKSTGLFEYVSGHDNAFGVGIKKTNLKALKKYLETIPSSDELVYLVDYKFKAKTITSKIVKSIGKMKGCWGTGVKEPKFAFVNIPISKSNVWINGKNKDVITFKHNGVSFYKRACSEEELEQIQQYENFKITVIGTMGINIYENAVIPQITMDDFYVTKSKKKANEIMF